MSSSPEKIVILSFVDRQIYVLDYDSNLFHNVEDFFLTEEVLEADLSINNCEYMIIPTKELFFKFSL